MTEVVLFQLYAPLVAWGGETVGDHRPSHSSPTRSAVLGLVAAGLGIRHDDDTGHDGLQAAYWVATETWRAGDSLEDYHTIQNPRGAEVRAAAKGAEGPVQTRPRALEVAGKKIQTVVSRRAYRQDAYHRVVLWPAVRDPDPIPARLVEGLLAPRWALHLGRRTCVPALPLDPRVVHGKSLRAVLLDNPPRVPESIHLGEHAVRHLTWERGVPAGVETLQVGPTRDARRGASRTFAVRELLRGELR